MSSLRSTQPQLLLLVPKVVVIVIKTRFSGIVKFFKYLPEIHVVSEPFSGLTRSGNVLAAAVLNEKQMNRRWGGLGTRTFNNKRGGEKNTEWKKVQRKGIEKKVTSKLPPVGALLPQQLRTKHDRASEYPRVVVVVYSAIVFHRANRRFRVNFISPDRCRGIVC